MLKWVDHDFWAGNEDPVQTQADAARGAVRPRAAAPPRPRPAARPAAEGLPGDRRAQETRPSQCCQTGRGEDRIWIRVVYLLEAL